MPNWPDEALDEHAVWFDQQVDENEFTIPDFEQQEAMLERQAFA